MPGKGGAGGVIGIVKLIIEGDTIGLTKALQGAERAVAQAGRRLTNIGASLSLKLTAPLTIIGGLAFKAAADFDAALRKIEGLVGINRDTLESWKDDIRGLAVEYGTSAEKAADALFFITSAGLRGSVAMDTLEASLKASAIGLGETQVIADAATSAMNAYGAEVLSATRATEIITGAVRAGKLEAENLAPVLGRLLPIASKMGVSFEQIAGTLAVFSRTGTDAAEGATSLQAIMTSLIKPSTQGEAVLKKYGISMGQLREVARGPGGLIQVMRLLENTIGDNEEEMATIIPNIRAFRGVMNALAQDADTVDQILADTANSVGIVDEAFAAAQGPAFRLKQAMAAVKDTLDSIGEAIIPIVVPALQTMTSILIGVAEHIRNMSDDSKKLITIVLGLTAAIGPLLIGVGTLLRLTAALKIGAVIAGFFKWAKAVVIAAKGVQSLTGAMAVLRVAMGPTGWIILGITAVAALTYAWLQKQKDLGDEIKATKERLDEYRQSLASMNQEQKEAEASKFRLQMSILNTTLQQQRDELKALQDARLKDVQVRRDGTEVVARETEAERELRAEIEHSENTLHGYEAQHVAVTTSMRDTVLTARELDNVVDDVNTTFTTARTKAEDITDALDAFNRTLLSAKLLQEGLGQDFDYAAAQASAFEGVIRSLANSNVDLDQALNEDGVTLRALIAHFLELKNTQQATRLEQDQLTESVRTAAQAMSAGLVGAQEQYTAAVRDLVDAYLAGRVPQDEYIRALSGAQSALDSSGQALSEYKSLLEASQTPAEQYAATLERMQSLLAAGVIGRPEFNRVIAQAQKDMRASIDQAKDVGDAFEDAGRRGLQAFTDFATGAGGSFSDFVNSAIQDLERLIAKIIIVKTLTSLFGGGGFLGGLFGGFFQHGGYLQPGRFGIVGETGPELVQAGRTGVSIAPMQNTAPTGMTISLDVSALPPPPRAQSPDALATDDWWRRAFTALKLDYDDRGGR